MYICMCININIYIYIYGQYIYIYIQYIYVYICILSWLILCLHFWLVISVFPSSPKFSRNSPGVVHQISPQFTWQFEVAERRCWRKMGGSISQARFLCVFEV